MKTLLDYIYHLQDAEYERQARAMMEGIALLTRDTGSDLLQAIVDLERQAKDLEDITSSPEYAIVLAKFKHAMNQTERLVIEYAPEIELSGAVVAQRAVTANLFRGTAEDMIRAGIDPVSAQAMSYFMDIVKDKAIPYLVPKASELLWDYTDSEAFVKRMEGWGDGYAKLFQDMVEKGLEQGWNPIKTAREMRRMGSDLPLNSAYTWTRTLQLQSYRDASAEMERLNGEFIQKKVRIAALDDRTCFPKGTMIKTDNIDRPIEDIKVGDYVITHKGRKRKVNETLKRSYGSEMVTIVAGKHKLSCTSDHPILISRGGHCYWEVAKNIASGDKIFVFDNNGLYNLNHVGSDLSIKWGIRYSDNEISLTIKPLCFPDVRLGSLRMPINTINFEGDIPFWKVKINSISVYFRLLFKWFTKLFKTQSDHLFWLCFTCVLMITAWGTKYLMSGTWTNSIFFLTIFADIVMGRSTTFLRAIMSIFCFPNIKLFPTSFTCDIPPRCIFTSAFRATIIGVSNIIRFGNPIFFSAACTDFINSNIQQFAFCRTIDELNSFFDLAWSKIKLFIANNTCKIFPIPFLPDSVAVLRATHVPRFGSDLRFENLERFSADPTDFNNIFSIHEVTSSRISNLNYNIDVYNLEVEEDSTYIANGIVVHNCPTCIALHGTEVPIGEPIHDHYNGRCDAIYIPLGGSMPEYMQSFSKPGQRNFVDWQTGEDWFAGLSDEKQKSILGAGKFEWYKKEGSLQGLVGSYKDSVFGEMPVVKPLWEIEGYKSYVDKLRQGTGFVDAKTIEDAEKYAKNIIGVEFADYRGLPIEVANDWNRALHYYKNEFPIVSENLNGTGTMTAAYREAKKRYIETAIKSGTPESIAKKQASKVIGTSPQRALGASFQGSFWDNLNMRGVYVNKNVIDRTQNLTALISADEGSFHPIGFNNLKAILDHEIGHQLDNLLGISGDKGWMENVLFHNIHPRERISYIRDNLSEYATRNYGEMVAEAWGEYLNNPKPRRVATVIGERILELYKEKYK